MAIAGDELRTLFVVSKRTFERTISKFFTPDPYVSLSLSNFLSDKNQYFDATKKVVNPAKLRSEPFLNINVGDNPQIGGRNTLDPNIPTTWFSSYTALVLPPTTLSVLLSSSTRRTSLSNSSKSTWGKRSRSLLRIRKNNPLGRFLISTTMASPCTNPVRLDTTSPPSTLIKGPLT